METNLKVNKEKHNEKESSFEYNKLLGKENCNSKKKIDVLSKNDYKRNCSTQKTKSPKNELNDNIQLSRSPQKLLNTSKLNTSTYCKTPKESRKIDNLIRHQNSNETLDKFLNENYKNGYKKEYELLLKKNNDSFLKSESKSNISISKNTSVSKTPHDINSSKNIGVNNRNKQTANKSVDFKKESKLNNSLERTSVRVKKDSFNTSNFLNTSKYSTSSVNQYLDRRHYETQEKISNMRSEQIKTEYMELREKPQISKNSMIIAEKLGDKNVFQRLTCNSRIRRREEELKSIERNSSKVLDKPKINDSSQLMTRTLDDLYIWKRKVDSKKERKYEEELNVNYQFNKKIVIKPVIENSSEKILRERVPHYLDTKVEDRLIGKGELYKIKVKENIRTLYENIAQTPQHKKIAFMNNSKFQENDIKKDDFQIKYLNTNPSSPIKIINTMHNTQASRNNTEKQNLNPNIEKLLEVRKHLSSYLQSKFEKEKNNNSHQQNENEIKTETKQQFNQFNATEKIFSNNSESNSSIFNNQLQNNNSNQISKSFNFGNGLQEFNQGQTEYIFENKKELNPFSEIDKYDNLIMTDKPYNYFSNYNYSHNTPSINSNFKRIEKNYYAPEQKNNLTKVTTPTMLNIDKNTLNPNNSESVKNNTRDIKRGFQSNMILQEKYSMGGTEKNEQLMEKELLQKNIENKKNYKSNSKPVNTGNTTISNITTIPKFESNSKTNNSIIDSLLKQDCSRTSIKNNHVLADTSQILKRKDLLNNFKNYLNEVETSKVKEEPYETKILKQCNVKIESVFKNNYDRTLDNLDSVNERLKLNDESKKYIFSKMNLFNKMDNNKSIEIGAEIEKYNRKK